MIDGGRRTRIFSYMIDGGRSPPTAEYVKIRTTGFAALSGGTYIRVILARPFSLSVSAHVVLFVIKYSQDLILVIHAASARMQHEPCHHAPPGDPSPRAHTSVRLDLSRPYSSDRIVCGPARSAARIRSKFAMSLSRYVYCGQIQSDDYGQRHMRR
jgi:hypothetical protein